MRNNVQRRGSKPAGTPLRERAAAARDAAGRFIKRKLAEPAPQSAEPPEPASGRVIAPTTTSPAAYGLRVQDGSLGLHATPGAIVVVDPTVPLKAGLNVFYLKGRTVPAIFDLPRTFNPELGAPFAPGSEVMPLVEAFAPETGALCRIRADRIEKAHRIIGIQTPVESGAVWRPIPKKLPEFAQCPEGMGEHFMADACAYPVVRPGETLIFDPSQRDPENVALFVLEWSNGARSVLETNFRQSGGTGDLRWWVDPVNRPVGDGALDRRIAQGLRGGLLYSSDGPYTEEHLRERIVGRVVGILAPQERPRDDDSEATAKTPALPTPALVPGSPEAMAAWHAACHEHSIRMAPLNDCPELTRSGHEAWTVRSLMQAMEIGEITVAEYARLQPLASERELRIAEITHELRIGELFALAYANEYPVASDEDAHGPDRDWSEWAAHHPGFLPFPQRRPTSLLKLEYATPQEAAYLLELAEAELDRRRQAYVRHRDPTVWPRVAADLRRDLRMDALAIVAAPHESKVPADPAGEDPIFAAIQAHADARAAFSETVNPQDAAWVRERGGDTSAEAMAPAHAAYEAANAVEMQTWAALFEVRPTTMPGVLALLRHCQKWAPSNDGQAKAPEMEEVFGIIADGLENVAALTSTGVLSALPERDPVFTATATADQADAAMAAWDNAPYAMAGATEAETQDSLSLAQGRAYRALLATTPTTVAGLRALVEHTKKWIVQVAGDDWEAKVKQEEFGDVYLSLVNAIAAIHGTHAEHDEPLTVESAATLNFEPYTFDTPLRSPQEWAGELNEHAIAMHIADKTLRMSKPELMAFVRDANKRGDGTDGLMWKALNAASDTFDGWAKFLHLAGSRYLVAGASATVEDETENGGA